MEVLFPDYKQVEKMVHEKGMNLFYEFVESEKLCQYHEKLNP